MAAPTSKIDICNLALSHLRAGIVADIDTSPTTDAEKECARWYDATRRDLLRNFMWNFAKDRTTISRGGTPSFGFDDYYNLPVNFIRLIEFGKSSDDVTPAYHWLLNRTIYELEGKKILLNNDGESSLRIVYIKDATLVTEFDTLFISTLALALAYNMAYSFTTKKAVVDRIKDQLEIKTQQAVSIDGQERPPKHIAFSRFKESRRRNGTSTVASPYTVFRR